MFLETSLNSQESTCASVSISIKLQAWACNFTKKETLAQVFFCEFREIGKNNFSYKISTVVATESWDHILFFLIFLLGCYYLGKLGTSKSLHFFWWNRTKIITALPSSCYFLPQNKESSKSLMIFLLFNKLSWILRSHFFFQCHRFKSSDHDFSFTIHIILWSHDFHLTISQTASSSKSAIDIQVLNHFCKKVPW